MIKIRNTGMYSQMLENLVFQNPELESGIKKRTNWFKKNPSDSRLRNHALRRRMKGKCAFSITDDIRIVYEWVGESTVRFLAIGKHSQVYIK